MGFGEASDVSACYYAGANDKYTGMNQDRMAYFHYGDAKFIMLITELLKNTGNRNLRLGLNQWYYDIIYGSNTTRFDQQVIEYPRLLSHTLNASSDSPITNYAYNSTEVRNITTDTKTR